MQFFLLNQYNFRIFFVVDCASESFRNVKQFLNVGGLRALELLYKETPLRTWVMSLMKEKIAGLKCILSHSLDLWGNSITPLQSWEFWLSWCAKGLGHIKLFHPHSLSSNIASHWATRSARATLPDTVFQQAINHWSKHFEKRKQQLHFNMKNHSSLLHLVF